MFNKRGSLSISTNAIVVLIIAVIMLGLIIGLVTRGFSAVEERFLAQIEDLEADPANPSASQPVTLSSPLLQSGSGEWIGLKIKIRNTGDTAAWMKPDFECLGDNNNPIYDDGGTSDPVSEQVFPKEIQPGEFEQFTYAVQINPKAESKEYLCQMGATDVEVTGNPAEPEEEDDGRFLTETSGTNIGATIAETEFRIIVE